MYAQDKKEAPYNLFIELENRIYNPGDVINGELHCRLAKKLCAEELVVYFDGVARVHWEEAGMAPVTQANAGDHSKAPVTQENALRPTRAKTPYQQRRALTAQSATVWRWKPLDNLAPAAAPAEPTLDDILRRASSHAIRPSNLQRPDQRRGIEAGDHRFEFTFNVPPDGLETSTETSDGLFFIRYTITAKALLNGFTQAKGRRLFPIVVHRPLSIEHALMLPALKANSIQTKKLGAVDVSLSLPKTGFVPGEPLGAIVSIKNRSSESIKYAHVDIVQHVTAVAAEPFPAAREGVYPSSGVGLPADVAKVPSGGSVEYATRFHVPALTPSLNIDGLAKVEYDARLTIGYKRGSPKHALAHIRIPIVIGTSSTTDKNFAKESDELDEAPPSYKSLMAEEAANVVVVPSAPPAYEEAVAAHGCGVVDDEAENGNEYAPLYYSYRRGQGGEGSPQSVLLRSEQCN